MKGGKGRGKGGKERPPFDDNGDLKTAVCELHGKKRGLNFLRDMGNGRFQCKEGFECK